MSIPFSAPFLLHEKSTLVPVGSLIFLGALGMIGAKAGGAGVLKPTIRVMFWGALAMALTAGIGAVVGKAV